MEMDALSVGIQSDMAVVTPEQESDPFLKVSSDHQSSHGRQRPLRPVVYRLRRFTWRGFLGIIGPLIVLGFYGFICFNYLVRPAQNDIVPNTLDARWVYYGWFVTVVFSLDWARTGLANIEAVALMHPRLAPRKAMGLMWHTDLNWSNFLWWLRGFRNILFWLGARALLPYRRRPSSASRLVSVPEPLWWFLSASTLLLFVSIPLSGLTFELRDAFVLGTKPARIFGPTPATLINKAYVNLKDQVRGNWLSGRPTTPLGNTILYASAGTANVSTTYYNDRITSGDRNGTIRIFAGPAVEEIVHGDAWGLEANITCYPTGKESLKLISVAGFNDYTIHKPHKSRIVAYANETGLNLGTAGYSLVIASESRPEEPGGGLGFYDVDHSEEDSEYLFEAFLWQGFGELDDVLMREESLQHEPNLITIQNTTYFETYYPHDAVTPRRIIGFGIR